MVIRHTPPKSVTKKPFGFIRQILIICDSLSGWIDYTDDRIQDLCEQYLAKGFTAFKLKVGRDIRSDISRCRTVRKMIGPTSKLMVDANQMWEVNEAIDWMRQLQEFDILWIEEPTSPDDVLGHAKIAESLA